MFKLIVIYFVNLSQKKYCHWGNQKIYGDLHNAQNARMNDERTNGERMTNE